MIYNRPVFSLFGQEDPNQSKIESSGDTIRPAVRSGKLLASGEAGYYDIQKQSHKIERPSRNEGRGRAFKPFDQGISFKYPNPPEPRVDDDFNFDDRHSYWGLPSGENKGYFQSGIFVKGNDHREGEVLDYYYQDSGKKEPSRSENEPFQTNVSLHSGIFHYDGGNSKFSTGFGASILSKYWSRQGNTYIPRSNAGFGFKLTSSLNDAVSVKSIVFVKSVSSQSSDSGSEEGSFSDIYEENFEFNSIKTDLLFFKLTHKGIGLSLDEAVLDAAVKAIGFTEGIYIDSETSIENKSTTTMTRDDTRITSSSKVVEETTLTSVGVVGRIFINSIVDNDGIIEVSVDAEVIPSKGSEGFISELNYAPAIVTNDLIMIHKGTGELGEPLKIPYLGDYEVVDEGKFIYSYPEEECKDLKTDVDKFLEGQEIKEIKEEGDSNGN